MDILTQGLLGGVLAQAVCKDDEKKTATLAGFAAGLLADADVLIHSSSDPLLSLEYHRHFTHALIFIPFGAALAALLLWPLLRKSCSWQRLYLFCFAGYSLSGLLDACTSYGTQLFWPFSEARIAFNIISILDPVFTLALAISLVAGLWMKQRVLALYGLAFCLLYLSFGKLQQERASLLAQHLIEERGHSAVSHIVKPTLANLLLWRSVYRDDERIYVDAIRMGVFSEALIYQGESLPIFSFEKDMHWLETDSLLYRDIGRFIRFSDGYVANDPTQHNVIGDIRYSMLPISAKPLWGIRIDQTRINEHVDYQFYRENAREVRPAFKAMLLGRDDVKELVPK
ncbi:MAG: metal-dependent hydrolase [Gammaproteobacteria bacterium]|nr:metal-dependent hydrolase [Gammaproteobacteria bacterium]